MFFNEKLEYNKATSIYGTSNPFPFLAKYPFTFVLSYFIGITSNPDNKKNNGMWKAYTTCFVTVCSFTTCPRNTKDIPIHLAISIYSIRSFAILNSKIAIGYSL